MSTEIIIAILGSLTAIALATVNGLAALAMANNSRQTKVAIESQAPEINKIHTAVNSNSDRQDAKIESLQKRLDDRRDEDTEKLLKRIQALLEKANGKEIEP